MSVTFLISITPPADDVIFKIEGLLRNAPSPAVSDFAGFCVLIKRNLEVAAGMWGRCFRSEERVELEIRFKDTDSELAGGRSKGSADFGKSKRYPGKTLIMEGAAYQIAGYGMPTDPGILIELPASEYLTHHVWLDPDAIGGSQPVPEGRLDAVTLFLHEMAHGLGFNGRLVQDPGRAKQWGEPEEDRVSTYDEWVQFDGKNFFFDGPFAMAENGGVKVPLSDRRGDNNDHHHIGNDAGQCALGRSDLMTGYPWKVGHRYCISRLDLAILKDAHLPIL
jgi:hypothetical protein